MPVVVRRPGPPLRGLVQAIVYRAGQQPQTSVEKILPGPETSLWVNLNRDAFRSFHDAGQVSQVPGAMLAGPPSRASVIEFEQGHAHVSVTFALGAASRFTGPALAATRDELVPLDLLWGRSGGGLPRVGAAPPGAPPRGSPGPALAAPRDELVPLDLLWGRSGACLRERLLEAGTPEDALSGMEKRKKVG